MSIDWPTLATVIIAALGGSGITALFTIRHQSRKLDADAAVVVGEAWSKLVQPLQDESVRLRGEVSGLRCEVDNLTKMVKDKDGIIESQNQRIQELEGQVEARDTRIAALEEKVAILERKRK
jgi:peptidoglycan hydrolase CwlO-like protein